jgi:hypothetical protein
MLSLMHNGMVAPLFRHVDQRAITHQQYASSEKKVSNGKRGEETQHLF